MERLEPEAETGRGGVGDTRRRDEAGTCYIPDISSDCTFIRKIYKKFMNLSTEVDMWDKCAGPDRVPGLRKKFGSGPSTIDSPGS